MLDSLKTLEEEDSFIEALHSPELPNNSQKLREFSFGLCGNALSTK